MPRRFPSSVLQRPSPNFDDLYCFGRCLGKGQFGTTYLCVHKRSLQEYACKVISKRKLLLPEDVDDVRREIHILHHLSGQPSIVEIKGSYEDDRYVYLVMELCSGGELFERIVSRGHYSEKQARNLIRTIVTVVEICHSLGVMHRDLKPENFLFSGPEEDSPLKAIDFGLSIFFQPGNIYYDVVGSPYYVAPEVLNGAYGPEADIWSAGVILYILLTGLPPFWAETDQGIFEQIQNSNVEFNAPEWSEISESAKELIRNMLNPDPSERFTAYQVHCHPWISEDGIAPDRPLDPIILSRMKKFMLMNKIKKIALQVIAQRLSEEEIAGLKEIFKMLDVDNSGTITFQELKSGLERFGSGLTDSEVQSIMEAADLDNSGSIDYKEFLAATLNLNKLEKEENLLAAFLYFDKDCSGFITKEELQQACLEHRVAAADIAKIIEEIDQNQDGYIDYNEFVAMMRKETGVVSRRYAWNSIVRTLDR